MMLWIRKSPLMGIYPAGVAEFQALMPPGSDGARIQFGLMGELLACSKVDPQGVEWVYLEDPRLTRDALNPVFQRAFELGFSEPGDMFVAIGVPDGFV